MVRDTRVHTKAFNLCICMLSCITEKSFAPTWYISLRHHLGGCFCYGRYVRRRFLWKLCFVCGRMRDFLKETYHSILLQRLTHHDGVQGVVRRDHLAMGATPAGHMYLPVAPPQKCLPTVRAIEPCRRWW